MKRFYVISLPRAGGTVVQQVLSGEIEQICEGESGQCLELLWKAEKARGEVKGSWRPGERRGVAELPLMNSQDVLPCGRIARYGMRSSYFGREGWETAVEGWSWLLRDPDAVIVFVIREDDPEGRTEMSLWGTSPLWIPGFGKCAGNVLNRWRAMRRSMLDFHEMNPTRTVLIHFEELERFEVLREKLGRVGLDAYEAGWLDAGRKRPGRLKEASAELFAAVAEDGAAASDEDPFAGESDPFAGAEDDMPDLDAWLGLKPAKAETQRPPVRVKLPAPVIELHPPGDRPTMSVSIMAHPSRAAWVEELRSFFGPQCQVAMDDGRGMLGNGMEAWRLHDRAAEWHLVIQDDAVPCEDFVNEARRYLAGMKEPGAVSFYHSGKKRFVARARKALKGGELKGWLRWGPAIALPVAWISEMLEYFGRQERPQYDTRIGDWLKTKGVQCWYPLPSLVDHRPGKSLIGNDRRGLRAAAAVRKVSLQGRTMREVSGIPDGPAAIVYPWISTKVAWEELRFSLRSVERHFEDKECPIYILCDRKPGWLREGGRVRAIELDGYERNARAAVWQAKVIGLQLAERVLWMNDDFYLVRDQGWKDFETALHAGKADAGVLLQSSRGWTRNIGAVTAALNEAGIRGTWRFSTHTPQLYERTKSLEVLRRFYVPFNGGLENLYHGWHGTPRRPLGKARVSELPARGRPRFLNHGKEGPNEATRRELERMFAAAAPWEIDVPKIIHQIWSNDDPRIPRDVYPEEWTESWKVHHPEWECRLWSREDLQALVASDYPEFSDLMARAREVIKADVGRLLVLHKFGGLYADLDYLCLRPMGALVDAGEGWVSTLPGGYTNNSLMAGIPGYGMWLAAAHEALKRWKKSPKSQPEWISGPGLIETMAEEWKPRRWTGAQVCPLDWRSEDHLGDWRELAGKCGDAAAVTFWRHNW